MAEKTLAVVVPAGEDGTSIQEVTVVPGTSAQDVLNTLGKGAGYILGTLSGQVFKPKDLIYSSVADGDKLVITPSAEAGAKSPASPLRGEGCLAKLARLLFGMPAPAQDDQHQLQAAVTPSAPVTTSAGLTPHAVPAATTGGRCQVSIAAAKQSILVATPGKTVVVRPKAQPAWKEKGWKEVSPGVYEGNFQGRFKGRVEFSQRGFQRAYIWSPPPELQRHPKAMCFSHQGGGKYQVHFHHTPAWIDSAIMNIERILSEAYAMGGGKNGR